MRPVPPTPATISARCDVRANEAAERGDVLEAQYWQSAAAAAQRRQAASQTPPLGLVARLYRLHLTPTSRQERVA